MGLDLLPAALQGSPKEPYRTDSLNIVSALAPGLLRYHHCWQQRQQWINSAIDDLHAGSSRLELLGSDSSLASITAGLLLTGDWLEILLTSKATPRKAVQLSSHLERYRLSETQRADYSTFHLVLQQALIPESYLLSVQAVAEYRYELKHTAFSSLMPATVGFLSGADGGIAALPVLWQIQKRQPKTNRLTPENIVQNRETTLSLADHIYRQWSGVLGDGMSRASVLETGISTAKQAAITDESNDNSADDYN